MLGSTAPVCRRMVALHWGPLQVASNVARRSMQSLHHKSQDASQIPPPGDQAKPHKCSVCLALNLPDDVTPATPKARRTLA